MKLLVVASSLDLRQPLSATPAWWQLLKGLAENGVELIVAPYQGPSIESPWWTAAANPCRVEGEVVSRLKRRAHRPASGETTADRLMRGLANRFSKPRWHRHLAGILEQERDVEAVLFLTVPPNHFVGVPRALERRFGVPTYFYDGDVPASLPTSGGFQSGFKIYQGADLTEYAGFFSNSLGGIGELERLGARNAQVLYYAVDPDMFAPVDVPQDIDVFFYGHGVEYRESWIEAMLVQPSRALPQSRFAVRGTRLPPSMENLPYASLHNLNEYCCRSRINLLITRSAHASVYGSSTSRPFELAALGCAMVSNPYNGIQEWFEPGEEVVVINSAEEAIRTYRWLLRDKISRLELGMRARRKVLAQHTYRQRASELVKALRSAVGPGHATVTPSASRA